MGASVLTNSSAMIALQNLRSTNKSLAEVNNQISTGKKVANAKDSAAVFAISKIMESDVAGFKALNESLNLGEATVSVASNAANSIGNLLSEIKGKIVAANEENVDRNALQNEVASLRDQITSIVGSAQFNGLNLIDGSQTAFNVLSSLNRDASGTVTTGQVSLNTANTNLSAVGGLDVNGITAAGDAAGTDQSGTSGGFDNTGFQVVATTATFSVDIDNVQGGGAALDPNDSANAANPAAVGLLGGDRVQVTVGSITAAYTVRVGDIGEDVAAGLRTALIDAGIDTTDFTVATNGTALDITNNGTLEVRVDSSSSRGTGGLAGLAGVDVTTAGGAATALGTIENVIQNSVNAQAALGTVEKRLEIQNEFTTTLIDSFKAGIGALVDADLEEASARLQALQVQQQLGVQALSIANQGPQNILALFR
ncbi:MAG: flagellin [Pseudomonadota bacterium]